MADAASLHKLTSFLERLRDAKIHYRLSDHRPETVMVEIAAPGERWEVEFFVDGHVEVEIFKVDGFMRDEGALGELFARFSD
ncbi:MAG TPA: hypothetical protein VGU25_09765 [Acidobacteriaceae bacterium]|nr:hypothetical protein [Acidobacteriaceae bacterium]